MIEIYGSNDRLKCQVEAGSSSQQDKALQSDNVLSLSFTHYAFLELDVNDWCEFAGERYWLQEKYLPKQKNEHEWEYNVKLYGIESLIKRLLVLQNSDGENEAVFTLTAPASEHVRLIVQSMNDGMDHTTNWKVGDVVATENLTIDYDGTYCDEGLRLVAEAAGTEWWIEGETVNLCRCEQGAELLLRYSESLLSLDRDEADGVKFYTRLFPIGSSRNIDRSKYGSTRLQLPGGAKYVDIPDLVERYGVFHHYEQEAFSGIYPRRVGVISSVRWEEVKDPDGNPFTIWYFKDNGLTFDPNDYEIAGLVKHVSFQSGELEGRDFEVNYNSETREFEIITTWPYDDDMQLPDAHGGHLVPAPGNTYILWNIRMPDEYYDLAEKEYQSAVEAFNREHLLDKGVYKAPTNPKWVERSGAQLYVGRRVRLESQKYFPKLGYRSSRITRLTRKVSDPYQIDLEISDAVSTGTMTKIEDSIHDVKMYVRESSSVLPDIIRSWDETKPTDNNIYSARRTHKEFLSKNTADRAKKKIIFDEGIEAGEWAEGTSGAALWQDQDGNWHLESDYVNIRKKLTAQEVAIQDVHHVGGQMLLTAASCKADFVVDKGGYYRVFFLRKDGDGNVVKNLWRVGDQAYCQTFNLTEETTDKFSNTFYWRLVTGVSSASSLDTGTYEVDGQSVDGSDYHYIDLSNDTAASGSDAPAAGDDIVQLGYRGTDDTGRQTAILIAGASADNSSPFIRLFEGINTFALPSDVEQLKPGDNRLKGVLRMMEGSTLEDGRDINHLGTSRGNLLKNTGFTGDFESVEVTEEGQTITDAMPIYSDKLKYWDATNVEVLADTDSASGYSAKLGVLSQTVDGGWKDGEWYMLSLRAAQGTLTIEAGGETKAATLTDWERIDFPFQASTTDGVVRFSGTAKVCEIMLTIGNLPTEWHKASTDNDKSMAEFISLDYLRKAITDATTNIIGGLVMTQILKVGNYRDGRMSEETGGMSGAYNDDKSPFLWGGGTMEDAIYTIMMYAKNPAYQPTEEEVSRMAKFVVTHGGRAILNDIVLRGYVYALGGVFNGTIYAHEGVFTGFIGKKKTIITPSNIASYSTVERDPVYDEEYYLLHIERTGTWLEFRDFTDYGPALQIPYSYGGTTNEDARRLVGNTVLIYNYCADSQAYLTMTGNYHDNDGPSASSFAILAGHCAYMECKCGANTDGKEEIYRSFVLSEVSDYNS